MPVQDVSGGFGNTGFGYKRSEALPATLNNLQEQLLRERKPPLVPTCYVYLNATITTVTATVTQVIWDAAKRNYTGANSVDMWEATDPGRIIIPPEFTTASWWDVTIAWRWNLNATGRRVVVVGPTAFANTNFMLWDEKSGATAVSPGVGVMHNCHRKVLIAGGEDLKMWVYQDSGGNLAGGRINASIREYWEASMMVSWSHPDG